MRPKVSRSCESHTLLNFNDGSSLPLPAKLSRKTTSHLLWLTAVLQFVSVVPGRMFTVTTGSWGHSELPLLPRALRSRLAGQTCPGAVLDACAATVGTLDQLDGRRLRPASPEWPEAAITSVAELVGALFEQAPDILEFLVWPTDTHLEHSLSDLPLTTRAQNCLRRANLFWLRHLQGLTWCDLTTIRNLGLRSLLDILCALEQLEGTPDQAQLDEEQTRTVLLIWSEITQLALSDELTKRFHREARHLFLTTWPAAELRTAGSRIHALRGSLRLIDWADELAFPGTTELATMPLRWAENTDDEAETLRQALTDLLASQLPDRELQIICQLYGLPGFETSSLTEIAASVGLSRERVRQLHEKAIRTTLDPAGMTPKHRALLETLQTVVDDGAVIPVALAVLPETPIRTTVDLIFRLLGASHEERKNLREPIQAALRSASRDQRDPERILRREEAESTASARFDVLRRDAFWPTVPVEQQVGRPVPLRLLTDDAPPFSFASAKMSREIAAESATELRFFKLCETCPDVDWYCEQPAMIEYHFDDRQRVYYPDVVVGFTDGTRLLVEVKDLAESSFAINQAKWAAARAWCAEQGLGFLVTDGRASLRAIEDHLPDPRLVRILTRRLEAGPITWLEHQDLRRELSITRLELTAAILQQGWDHRVAPWRLSLGRIT